MAALYIWREALRIVARFRARSLLMTGATAIGAASMIVSANYSAAGRARVLERIGQTGTDLIIVTPRQSRNVAGRARTGTVVMTLVPGDREAIAKQAPGIASSSEIATGIFLVQAGALSKPFCPVIGCEAPYIPMKNWGVQTGRFFDERDERAKARVAVLGASVAADLFLDEWPVGQHVLINRVPMEVIGVMAERGQGLDTANEDAQVYVPVTTAMTRLMNRTYLDSIVLRARVAGALQPVVETTNRVLLARHRIRFGSQPDFNVQNQETELNTLNKSSVRLTFLIRSVGLSSLGVSGLGVFALTWVAIRARTAELGTRRAIGAAAAEIFLQLFLEAAIVSIIGAVAAAALGFMASRLAESRAGLPEWFDTRQAAWFLLYSTALNQIFGLLAARRAAKVDPIAALKFE